MYPANGIRDVKALPGAQVLLMQRTFFTKAGWPFDFVQTFYRGDSSDILAESFCILSSEGQDLFRIQYLDPRGGISSLDAWKGIA